MSKFDRGLEGSIQPVRKLDFGRIPKKEKYRFRAFLHRKSNALKGKCLFPSCSRTAIKGHAVSRHVLKRYLSDADKVFSFDPVRHNWVFAGPLSSMPSLENINTASIGFFSCNKHDNYFKVLDEYDTPVSEPRVFNLMAYRSLLRQMHKCLAVRATHSATNAAKFPSFAPYIDHMRIQYDIHIKGLGKYKSRIEQCLKECDGGCSHIQHHEMLLNTPHSNVAISRFSEGALYNDYPFGNFQVPTSNWGLTVQPTSEHVQVVFHSFTGFETSMYKSKLLEQRLSGVRVPLTTNRIESFLEQEFLRIQQLSDPDRRFALTEFVFRYVDLILVRPSAWCALSDSQRLLLKTLFMESTNLVLDLNFAGNVSEKISAETQRYTYDTAPKDYPQHDITLF